MSLYRNLLSIVYSVSVLLFFFTLIGCGEDSKSNNADLTDITLDQGDLTPNFSSGEFTYHVNVDSSQNVIQFTIRKQQDSTVYLNDDEIMSSNVFEFFSTPINLDIGDNVFTFRVESEAFVDGNFNANVNTYTVTINRASGTGNSALLDSVQLLLNSINQPFIPVFDSGTFEYTITVPHATQSVDVTTQSLDLGTEITINNSMAENSLNESIPLDQGVDENGNNKVTVVDIDVISNDQLNSETYTLKIIRSASNTDALLTGLSISNVAISPDFQSSLLNYAVNTHFFTTDIKVTATLSDPLATMTLDGNQLLSGLESNEIVLSEGNNTVSVIVTAQDGVTSNQYDIDIHRAINSTLMQEAYIKASNTENIDSFGYSLDVYGDTLVVSSRLEDSQAIGINGDESDNVEENSGAVYVYTRNENKVWSQQAYIKANNTEGGDFFGHSVALYGNLLAVSAINEDSDATGINSDGFNNDALNSGAVYVFERDHAGQWSQVAYIKASNSEAFDEFGTQVSLFEDTLVVSARREDGRSKGINGDQNDDFSQGAESGAVYVFTRDANNNWSQQAYLKASNTDSGDEFGLSLDIRGDVLAVGAIGEDSDGVGNIVTHPQNNNDKNASGAVYVFTRDLGVWTQQSYIKPDDVISGEKFGNSVTLSDSTLAVGTALHNRVYIFELNNNQWQQQTFVTPSNDDESDHFGQFLAMSNGVLAISAISEDGSSNSVNGNHLDNSKTGAGAVYLFNQNAQSEWIQDAYIKTTVSDSTDKFGRSVALSGELLVAGATGEASLATGINGDAFDNTLFTSGAAYAFSDIASSEFTISLTISGTGSGSVTGKKLNAVNNSIDCGLDCTAIEDLNSTYLLTAHASAGSEFVSWTGHSICSANGNSNPTSVVINKNTQCVATFQLVGADITLTVNKDPSGTGDGEIQGIDGDVGPIVTCSSGCDSAISSVVDEDKLIEIYATPDAGSFVESWSGDSECSDHANVDNTYTNVTMSAAKTCTAKFTITAPL